MTAVTGAVVAGAAPAGVVARHAHTLVARTASKRAAREVDGWVFT